MTLPPVYTELFWSGKHTGSGAGTFTNGGPPSGIRWIVVDIVVQSGAIMGIPRGGFGLYDSGGRYVFAQYGTMDGPGFYHWNGRQVWEYLDTWSFNSEDPGTTWRITGYALTLP